MAGLNFNASTVDPQTSFDPIPAGWYNAVIEESEMKPTAKGGAYLELKLKVLDGQYQNRVVFDRLNLNCPSSETAQEIAYKTLSAICHAVNVIQVQDSQQLHNIPLQVKVSVRAAQGDYDASNDVKGYKAFENSAGQGTPTMQAPAQPTVAPQQPTQQPMQQPAMTQAPAQQAPAFQPPTQAPVQQPPQFQAPGQTTPVQQPVQEPTPTQQPQPSAAPANPALTQPQTAPGGEQPPWAQQQ